MRIGEVAASAGVNRQTIRFYEREGLLPNPTRRDNGYREYPADTVALVRFIKRAQDLGFSLNEAKALSDLRPTAGRDRPRVRALAEAKLADVRQRIAQLQAIERALAGFVTDCCRADSSAQCPILDALADPLLDPPARASPVCSHAEKRTGVPSKW
jgi:MerR family transcriptional regulator, copper efflux regulator